MVKGSGCAYKHIQPNCPYTYFNSTFFVPLRSLFTSQHDITNDYGITLIAHKQLSPLSNLTTTIQVETDSNNYDDTQSVATPINHNHSTPEKLKQQLQLLRFRLMLIHVYRKLVIQQQPHR